LFACNHCSAVFRQQHRKKLIDNISVIALINAISAFYKPRYSADLKACFENLKDLYELLNNDQIQSLANKLYDFCLLRILDPADDYILFCWLYRLRLYLIDRIRYLIDRNAGDILRYWLITRIRTKIKQKWSENNETLRSFMNELKSIIDDEIEFTLLCNDSIKVLDTKIQQAILNMISGISG
jgi:hypothetical protein